MTPQSDATVHLAQDPRGVILPVRAQAAARCNAILGVRDGMLRVAVTAAPEKGKANRAIIDLLSKSFGLPKSSIQVLSGETSSKKRVLLIGDAIDKVAATVRDLTQM